MLIRHFNVPSRRLFKVQIVAITAIFFNDTGKSGSLGLFNGNQNGNDPTRRQDNETAGQAHQRLEGLVEGKGGHQHGEGSV